MAACVDARAPAPLRAQNGLAPLALEFGAPAEGETMLAAAYRTGGRELHSVSAADADGARAEVCAKLGLTAPAPYTPPADGATAAASSTSAVAPRPEAAAEVIFVLGGPGSGKGTQCDLLTKHCGARALRERASARAAARERRALAPQPASARAPRPVSARRGVGLTRAACRARARGRQGTRTSRRATCSGPRSRAARTRGRRSRP